MVFRVMEVCGTHTEVIARNGLKELLADQVKLISGPGCPLCVIPQVEIDAVLKLARKGVTIGTFGDMMRVPGSKSSLAMERALGGDIRVVYSPLRALKIAEEEPEKKVAFLGIGFETTAPTLAVTIIMAKEKGIKNFAVVPLLRRMPPVLDHLFREGTPIQGMLLPGHVCTIIGSAPFKFLSRRYGMRAVVSGFTAEDILGSIALIKRQRRPQVEIQYRSVVTERGNLEAQRFMDEVFEPSNAQWRGFGIIPDSGLALRAKWKSFDALSRWGEKTYSQVSKDPLGCRCGDIMRGHISPKECPLYKKTCHPQSPQGPCMVSTEGPCALIYRYGG